VKPEDLRGDIICVLEQSLRKTMTGSCREDHGLIIWVNKILQPYPGTIVDGSGSISIPVRFTATIFKPQVDDVIDGHVESINKLGIKVSCGPMNIFISKSSMPSSLVYHERDLDASFINESIEIAVDTDIRLRIKALKYSSSAIYGVGCLDKSFLGVIVRSTAPRVDDSIPQLNMF